MDVIYLKTKSAEDSYLKTKNSPQHPDASLLKALSVVNRTSPAIKMMTVQQQNNAEATEQQHRVQ